MPVPVGTVVRDRDGAVVCDLATEGARFLVAEGGQGGRGNARFLSNRRRAPAFAEQGEKGQELWLDMELKLHGRRGPGRLPQRRQVDADLDRLGRQAQDRRLPLHHAGAAPRRGPGGWRCATAPSSSWPTSPVWSRARPRARASGHQFLRHIERARVLVVLLDLGAPDAGGAPPAEQRRVLLAELGVLPARAPRAPPDRGGQQGRRRRPTTRALCDLVLSAATGSRRRPRWSSGWPPSCRRRGRRRPRRHRARSSCTGPLPRVSTCAGRGPAPGSWSGRAGRAGRGALGPQRRRRAGRGGAAAAPPRRRPGPGAGGCARRRRGHGRAP